MFELNKDSLPYLYQVADRVSLKNQNYYFNLICCYLFLLVVAALISYIWPKEQISIVISLIIFLITIAILVLLKLKKPDDIWYNGRAVAESIKTRSWRWCMRSTPYESIDDNIAINEFIADQKNILKHNKSIRDILDTNIPSEPISETMKQIRSLDISSRLEIYKEQRIQNQIIWYSLKAKENKKKANFWFIATILLYTITILLLIYKITNTNISLPIEVITTAGTGILTWINSKKFNELHSSYKLTAHEILFIKMDGENITTEEELSEFIINSETAFSREHTQWIARKIS